RARTRPAGDVRAGDARPGDVRGGDGPARYWPGWPGGQDSPWICPSASRSMRVAAGLEPRPGMVRISPQIGYTNPAPAEARTSRTGRVHPVGAPFSAGSEDMDRWVLAMHTGSRPNPARS